MKVALTIAGSDSSGGAGVVADAVTFTKYGVWATIAVTGVTAQNPDGVFRVEVLKPSLVRAQIEAVAADVDAVKTGMLCGATTVSAVADAIVELGLPAPVVDPVMVSSSGHRLLDDDGVAAMRERLLPLAALVTPNVAEAGVLTGLAVADRGGMERAAAALVGMGCAAALVTGGHMEGDEVGDCLVVGAEAPLWLTGERVTTVNSHGTGCVLSAAIAAGIAQGLDVEEACARGAEFVRLALRHAVRMGVDPTLGRVSWLDAPP